MLMPVALADTTLADGSFVDPANPDTLVRVVDRTLDSVTVEQSDGARRTIAGAQVVDVGTVPHVVQYDGSTLDIFGNRRPIDTGAWARQQDADGRAWQYPPGSVNGIDFANASGTTPQPKPIADPSSVLGQDLVASSATAPVSTTDTETGAAVASAATKMTLVTLLPWALIAVVVWVMLGRRGRA